VWSRSAISSGSTGLRRRVATSRPSPKPDRSSAATLMASPERMRSEVELSSRAYALFRAALAAALACRPSRSRSMPYDPDAVRRLAPRAATTGAQMLADITLDSTPVVALERAPTRARPVMGVEGVRGFADRLAGSHEDSPDSSAAEVPIWRDAVSRPVVVRASTLAVKANEPPPAPGAAELEGDLVPTHELNQHRRSTIVSVGRSLMDRAGGS